MMGDSPPPTASCLEGAVARPGVQEEAAQEMLGGLQQDPRPAQPPPPNCRTAAGGGDSL